MERVIEIPYGRRKLIYNTSEASLITTRLDEIKPSLSGFDLAKKALMSPINSPKLSELAKGKKNCTIIISDHTRPVPSKDIVPNLISELKKENLGIEIKLLVATGCHRETNKKELIEKLGENIFSNYDVVVHDATNVESNVEIGILPSGAPLLIDRVAAEAELLISEGFIEPHFFAGFSGGRKSVLPGICGKTTVFGNHCSKFIDSPFARTGILKNNPINDDMIAAAKLANLQFILNVVMNDNQEVVAAFAGDPIEAHLEGCRFLNRYVRTEPQYADIVITSNGGAPLDQNLYQCVKSMSTAESTCNQGGTIIICAECADGHGGENFYNDFKNCTDPVSLYKSQMKVPQNETPQDQWQSQILARILSKFHVIVVTESKMKQIVEDMKMEYADSIDSAVYRAKERGGNTVTIIPNGVNVIIA